MKIKDVVKLPEKKKDKPISYKDKGRIDGFNQALSEIAELDVPCLDEKELCNIADDILIKLPRDKFVNYFIKEICIKFAAPKQVNFLDEKELSTFFNMDEHGNWHLKPHFELSDICKYFSAPISLQDVSVDVKTVFNELLNYAKTRHHPYCRDYLKDERKCSICKLIYEGSDIAKNINNIVKVR